MGTGRLWFGRLDRANFHLILESIVAASGIQDSSIPPVSHAIALIALIAAAMLATIIVARTAFHVPAFAVTQPRMLIVLYTVSAGILIVQCRRLDDKGGDLLGRVPLRSEWRLAIVCIPTIFLSSATLPLAMSLVPRLGLPLARVSRVLVVGEFGVSPLGSWVMRLCVGALLAPVVEEVLFRGFLYRSLARRWSGPRAATVSAGMFALCHLEWIGHFVFGLVMVALYVRARSLWLPMACHALNNGLVSLALLPRILTGPPRVMGSHGAHPAHVAATSPPGWQFGASLFLIAVILLMLYRRRYFAGQTLTEAVSW